MEVGRHMYGTRGSETWDVEIDQRLAGAVSITGLIATIGIPAYGNTLLSERSSNALSRCTSKLSSSCDGESGLLGLVDMEWPPCTGVVDVGVLVIDVA